MNLLEAQPYQVTCHSFEQSVRTRVVSLGSASPLGQGNSHSSPHSRPTSDHAPARNSAIPEALERPEWQYVISSPCNAAMRELRLMRVCAAKCLSACRGSLFDCPQVQDYVADLPRVAAYTLENEPRANEEALWPHAPLNVCYRGTRTFADAVNGMRPGCGVQGSLL